MNTNNRVLEVARIEVDMSKIANKGSTKSTIHFPNSRGVNTFIEVIWNISADLNSKPEALTPMDRRPTMNLDIGPAELPKTAEEAHEQLDELK